MLLFGRLCSLSSASLGSTLGVQTSSGRMSRPALRLTCFFSVCLPETPAPRKTLSSHRLTFLFPLQIWLTCLRLKIGKRKKEGVHCFISPLNLLYSDLLRSQKTPSTTSYVKKGEFHPTLPFFHMKEPQPSLFLLRE